MAIQLQFCGAGLQYGASLLQGVNLAHHRKHEWELRLCEIFIRTPKGVKLRCLLGFLRNDTRDGQGEKGIRKFQHFTGGSRPQGGFFLDLEMVTVHTAACSWPPAETFSQN